VFRAALRLAAPAAIALTAIVAAACAAPAGAINPSASPNAAIDPDSVVIRVDWEGGFVPPGVNLSRLPLVLVTADGRVITQGPQDAMYPGPLLPNLQVRTLTPEALADLLERAADDGLLVDAEYAGGPIADAATTVLRITVDGVTYTQSAYALYESLDASGMEQPADAPGAEGRAAMRSFLDALSGLPDDAYTGASLPYVADGMRVYSSEFVPDPAADWQPVQWPLEDLATAGESAGEGLGIRCQVVTGDDLASVLPLLEDANGATPFRSGGADYTLIVRPLLPGERGC
jgi:hypothetical protein